MSVFPKRKISEATDFYHFIHPTERKETVLFWDKTKDSKAWTCVGADENIDRYLDDLNYKTDIYFSPNEFYKWRLGKNLRRLTCFYVDVDCREQQEQLSVNDFNDYIIKALEDTLKTIGDNNIPSPNCVIYTGRGYHLYWKFEPVGGNCQPRWKAVMNCLVGLIKDADPACTDATRMMRLPNTYNSKSKTLSEFGYLSAEDYTFDELCDQILPYTRSEIKDFRAARAKKGLKLKYKNKGNAGKGSIYERWYLVYQDIQLLIKHHQKKNGGVCVPEGMRDKLLFHAANALSWFTHEEALEGEIKNLAAKYFSSLKLATCMSYCGSVLKRAISTKKQGLELRYKYKRETLYEELKGLIPEELMGSMRAIISTEIRKSRRAKSQRTYRKERGAMSRSEYVKRAVKRRCRAFEQVSNGNTLKEVAKGLGVSVSAVKGYVKAGRLAAIARGAAIKRMRSKCVALDSGRSPDLFMRCSACGVRAGYGGGAVLLNPQNNQKTIRPAGRMLGWLTSYKFQSVTCGGGGY